MRNSENLQITFLSSSEVSETQKTFMNLSLFKQSMRNSENHQITFLISSEVSEKKFGRIFATVRGSPHTLESEASPLPYTKYIG